MQFTTSALVVLALAAVAQASVIPLITSAGITQQTVDINGLRGTVQSVGPSANLVLAGSPWLGGQQAVVVGNSWGGQRLVAAGNWPAGIQVAPAGVQVITG